MKILLALTLAFAAAQAINYDAEWENFKLKYEKSYDRSGEEPERKEIYISNRKLIDNHNAEHTLGLHNTTLKENKFADLTSEEFLRTRTYTEYKPRSIPSLTQVEIQPFRDVPDSIDWREKGYVTPVKDQGQCKSCWAFSAVATMEGAWFKKTGHLVSLSEEQLVDCAREDGGGCAHGGWPSEAIEYVINVGGIDTEKSYPYMGPLSNYHCTASSGVKGAFFKKVVKLPANEEALKIATATQGPISVAIHVKGSFLEQFHSEGVYYAPNCLDSASKHAVTVVGYGTENGQDYWLVKNSWGTGWGEEGYIKMSRNMNNNCGIATEACYAVA